MWKTVIGAAAVAGLALPQGAQAKDAGAARAAAAARAQLAALAPAYRLRPRDVKAARVASVDRNGRFVAVKLRQQVDGVPVYRDEMTVVMTDGGRVIGATGRLHRTRGRATFALGARAAIARKLGTTRPARVRRVMYRTGDQLVAAYAVEVDSGRTPFAAVVAADDGRVLERQSLVDHAEAGYRVWAETTPPYVPFDGPQGTASTPATGGTGQPTPSPVPQNLVTLQNAPFSRNDPWLPDGVTTTQGNNVIARAAGQPVAMTAPGRFDRPYDFGASPTAAENGRAIATQAFYTTNFLHDWFYDAGFDEAAGNAQADDHGRGGKAGDPLVVDTADPAITKTSAVTPADGASPRLAFAGKDALDQQLVAHEWGHYMTNRLVGDGTGLTTTMAGGLGEGWSDFIALLMTVRDQDVTALGNGSWQSAYPVGAFAAGSYYFGGRRFPYSTDMAKDPLTFADIADDHVLPTSAPTQANGTPNSEVHNTGEVWATMLWESYASLLNAYPFAEAQDRMKRYLVASLKLTPPDPTLLEARDALIMAAGMNDPADQLRFWTAFAKRGAGAAAQAPDRDSETNDGVVESYQLGGALAFASAQLTDDVRTCDGDGYLDGGERGTLTVRVRNSGTATLSGATATATANAAAVKLPETATPFTPIAPGATGTVRIPVTLAAGGPTNRVVRFTIGFDDPSAVGDPGTSTFTTRAAVDLRPRSTRTDAVEASGDRWAATGRWRRTTLDGPFTTVWHASDAGVTTDSQLTSPALDVGSAPLTVSFRHRFDYRAGDNGAVELSADGGQTWTGAGAGYTGTSAGYPAFATQTLALGTAYAGKTIRLRFRSTTDASGAGPGWDVDDIAVTGITNTPFDALAGDVGCRYMGALTVAPSNPPADGATTFKATASVTDDSDGGVRGDTLTFSSSDPGQSVLGVVDNGDGTYTATIRTSKTVGTATVTATDARPGAPLVAQQTVTQTVPPAPTATVTPTATPTRTPTPVPTRTSVPTPRPTTGPAPGPAAPKPAGKALKLTKVRVSPRRFRARRGARLRFSVTRAGRVRIRIAGAKRHRTISRRVKAGATTLRLRTKGLPAGRYTVSIKVTAAGKTVRATARVRVRASR